MQINGFLFSATNKVIHPELCVCTTHHSCMEQAKNREERVSWKCCIIRRLSSSLSVGSRASAAEKSAQAHNGAIKFLVYHLTLTPFSTFLYYIYPLQPT